MPGRLSLSMPAFDHRVHKILQAIPKRLQLDLPRQANSLQEWLSEVGLIKCD